MTFDRDLPDRPILRVGIVLLPYFTLTAFSAFIDAIRLAADEGDKSRQLDCQWVVMTPHMRAVQASCGVYIQSHEQLQDPVSFDYLTVVGGLLKSADYPDPTLVDYLRLAAKKAVPLIGLGTGSFALAHAGLMKGRNCCVSWYHLNEFRTIFPDVKAAADQLFVFDRDRITCAGGTGVVDVAAYLIDKHLGRSRSLKILRLMHVDHLREPTTPQWQFDSETLPFHDRVRRAILLIEQNLADPLCVSDIARVLRISPRQLQRSFRRDTGQSLMEFARLLRLKHAYEQVVHTQRALTEIAYDCGFSDASHFARCFRRHYGCSPSSVRQMAPGRQTQ